MIIATRIVAILAMAPGTQGTTTFSDPALGLAFDYPSTWVAGKKTKDSSRFTIPIADSTETAELEVNRVPFHSSKEIWTTIQTHAAAQMKRELVRQWEQEILSVPMLFSQVNFTHQGAAKTTLTGLYYTRTAAKLMVRLTAPTAEFEKAQFSLSEAMQSLRTLDGSTPQEDDENIKLTPAAKPPVAPPKVTVIKTDGNTKPTGPAVDVPLTVSTKPVVMKLPQGWRAEGVEGGKLTLHHEDLSGPITVEVRSTLDSDPPQSALFKLSSETLGQFSAVTKREDTNNEPNKVGCLVTTVWRIGKGGDGDLMVHEAAGAQGDFYFLASYRLTNPALLANERKLLRGLLDQVSLQPGA
ncbi:MAG: hypothetical protein ACO1SV_23970 [Fimbriimonas sp.]